MILLRTAACKIKLGGGMDAPASTVWIKGVCVLWSGFAHEVEKIKETRSLQRSLEFEGNDTESQGEGIGHA